MLFEIDGSGVRKATLELTDCELKDAAHVFAEIADDIRHGEHPLLIEYKYGCVTVTAKNQAGSAETGGEKADD